jgi:glycosyltransferase involved in cell wall biosynthesis
MLPAFRRAGIDVEVVPLAGRLRIGTVRTLAERIRAHRAALVHTHTYGPNTTATVAALLAGRPPVIASLHNLSTIRGWRRRLQDRTLNRLRSAVVCVSEGVRRNYLAEVGAPPEKVAVLYNGIDLEAMQAEPVDRAGVREELGMPPDALVAVCVARLAPQKEHPLLIEAFARAAARNDRARLLLVGDGPTREAVAEKCRAPEVGGRVVMAGERSDVFRILRAADLAVLASTREGFSNVVLECLAAGLPLVATDVGGNREAMDGEAAGLLVPARDVEALAAALERMLAGEALRREKAEGALRRARRFDLERTVDETEAIYDRLLHIPEP